MSILPRAAIRYVSAISGSALVASAGSASAQKAPPADSATCTASARSISKGHPAKKVPDARAVVVTCGAIGAEALASGIAHLASESDTLALDAFMRPLDGWRDSTLMEAATQLATDRAATVQSRVFAIRYLTRLVNPITLFRFGDLIAGNDEVRDANGKVISFTVGCRGMFSSAAPKLLATPLPANYRERVQRTLQTLAADSSEPAAVQAAAHCANFSLGG